MARVVDKGLEIVLEVNKRKQWIQLVCLPRSLTYAIRRKGGIVNLIR